MEDSPKEPPLQNEEIPNNENQNGSEDVPQGQNTPAEIDPPELPPGDPNVIPERLRHSTRNQKVNYHDLHHKGFAKVARATALMDRYDKSSSYKEAVNDPKREQWLQAIQSE